MEGERFDKRVGVKRESKLDLSWEQLNDPTSELHEWAVHYIRVCLSKLYYGFAWKFKWENYNKDFRTEVYIFWRRYYVKHLKASPQDPTKVHLPFLKKSLWYAATSFLYKHADKDYMVKFDTVSLSDPIGSDSSDDLLSLMCDLTFAQPDQYETENAKVTYDLKDYTHHQRVTKGGEKRGFKILVQNYRRPLYFRTLKEAQDVLGVKVNTLSNLVSITKDAPRKRATLGVTQIIKLSDKKYFWDSFTDKKQLTNG